jgi:hypothetical protein
MFHLPEVPFNELHAFFYGSGALIFGLILLVRFIRSEVRPRKCVFCGEKIPADEHAHHLEICGLKMMLSRRQT